MAEMNAINHKGWLTWLGKALLAAAIIMVLSTVHGSSAMALSHVGPSSPGDRYSMTDDRTHRYRQLEVPVYFKDNPGSVRVFVEDTKWDGGAYFNGTPIYGPGGEFTVSGFQYDNLTGYWKGVVRAHMIGNAIFQFRLRLERSDGIIAYGTGRASQADGRYNRDDMTDNNGHYDKTMEMALPCSFTEPTHLGGPGSPYRLKLYDLDTWYPGWRNNNGKQPLSVSVYDESDGGREVAYYDGNDPEYQCGQYNAGDDGVYGKHGCMGENGVLYVEMTMYPGHKYKLVIHNVWKNNLIEYELPFDNIFYNISCEPKIDMRAAVDYIDEAGHKRASAQGKYNSQENNKSRSDVFVFDQWGHNARATWSSEGVSPDPAIIRKEDAKVTPGKLLTWWFRAHNVSGYPPPDETDFANFRTTFNGSTSGWDEMTVYPPRRATNWFQPSKRGGKLDRNNPQVTWGCSKWGTNCVDYHRQDWNKGVSFDESIYYHYRYRVRADDAEKTLCQRVRNSWPVGQDWKERFTPWACAYVPYDYPPNQPPPGGGDKDNSGVVPTARVANGKSTVQAGDDVQFSYSLTNTSGPTVSRQIVYKSYAFILKKEAQLPPNWKQKPYHYAENWGGGNGVGCGGRDIAPGAQGRCKQGVGGTSEKIYPGQTWCVPGQPKYNVSGIWLAQPGDKICSYIAVDNNWSVKNDVSANTFRASNIACVVVTKSPNLNLSGSDSYANKGFQGASVNKSDKVPGTDKRGSYSQYGLLTGDTKVINFGSAGYTTADSGFSQLACKLSYANTDSAQGNCNDLKNGLKPAKLFKNLLSTPSKPVGTAPLPKYVDLGALGSGSYYRSGELYIGKSKLRPGQHITIFVGGDVDIRGEITNLSNTYNKLSDIPSLTIKAENDIKVEPQVELITGTYVATGRFESCNGGQEKGDTLGAFGLCRSKLKINGAIVSEGSPVFRRTFGAGNDSDDDQWDTKKISSTAEWINYTPNLWLTTSNGSSGNQLEGLTTTQVTNLPVRY
ncbi:MAG: hypothetical protein ACFNZD_00870 [Candidatus Nanoperiomorbus sp.]